ncbi:hypothetical protein EK904_010354 [Melospiza melodia maxima]|nr:hypothetical protein EK904_010354 [Melospiza melodia maxima]
MAAPTGIFWVYLHRFLYISNYNVCICKIASLILKKSLKSAANLNDSQNEEFCSSVKIFLQNVRLRKASRYLPLAFSCFSSLFLLSNPPLHLPSVTGHHLAGSPQVGAAGGKYSSQQHTPSKAKENPLLHWRFGERACAAGVCAALSPAHASSAPPVNSFALSRTRKSTTKSNFLPSISQINNRPTAHEDIKMCISCSVKMRYFTPALAPEEAPLLQIHLSLLVVIWDLVSPGSVSKALLTVMNSSTWRM